MEWFGTANANLPAGELQRHIRAENLGEWCAAPPAINGTAAQGWAGLGVHREVIRDGLRFTLPGSAHALQWTLTAGARPGSVQVHCTLNLPVADAATAAAMERFLADWCAGLASGALRVQQQRAERSAAACEECPPWFG